LRNVNYGRDYTADIVADITTAREGDGCNNCGHQLRAVNGTQIASLRKVGPTISEAFGWSYLDSEGNARSVYLGSYSLNIERLMASIAGSHHDEHGLIWPISISPYSVHLITLAWKNKDNEASSMADTVYQSLSDAKIDCLYDDREESPGVKFNDADLIGIPIRLTISDKSIKKGGIEYKRRDQQERSIISTENIFPVIIEELKLLAE
jgi:prolyl-tRNA synthetase